MQLIYLKCIDLDMAVIIFHDHSLKLRINIYCNESNHDAFELLRRLFTLIDLQAIGNNRSLDSSISCWINYWDKHFDH